MFTELGSINKHPTIVDAITFETSGYIEISKEEYKDSKITLEFDTPINQMALIPKYLSDGNFLFVTVNEEKTLNIGAIVKESEKSYGSKNISDILLPKNKLTVLSSGSNFIVYLNDKEVFKFQSALFISGSVRIYGEAEEVFYACEIEEPQSTEWITNTNESNIEIKKTNIKDVSYMKLIGDSVKAAQIHQLIELSAGKHSISFTSQGQGMCKVVNSLDVVVLEQPMSNVDLSRNDYALELTDKDNYKIIFETVDELIVGEIQIESGEFASPYIPNQFTNDSAVRKPPILSYPLKSDFPTDTGSLYIKLNAKDFIESATTSSQLIAKTDDEQLKIEYANEIFTTTFVSTNITLPFSISSAEEIELLVVWDLGKVSITVNDLSVETEEVSALLNTIKSIIFAEENSILQPIILEEWALFNKVVTLEESIQEIIDTALIHSLFNGGVSGQNVTWVELPVAPNDQSPILVQKENGENLQKVSFLDYETGEYVTYNKEPFLYDGRSDFVEVAYSNLNEDFRDLGIVTEDGEKIGEPYVIEGKRFYFSLPKEIKEKLKDHTLFATYQVNDTYTIDYNIKAVDGYKIDFAKHDGSRRIVYQEGNRYGEQKKLATMIDMNPIQNHNHNGFLYVTNTVNKTESFRITATPDRLPADGLSSSSLIVEPLDYQGNFLSHSNIEIIAEKGFISRQISTEAVEAQKRSGQYLYQYIAPYIQAEVKGDFIEDYIWIIDRDNNIGIGYKMLIKPVEKQIYQPITDDEKNMLTTKSEIIEYLLMHEGIEKYEDETLFNILDLNQDGRVTVDEVRILESNERDGELVLILNKLHEWEDEASGTTTA